MERVGFFSSELMGSLGVGRAVLAGIPRKAGDLERELGGQGLRLFLEAADVLGKAPPNQDFPERARFRSPRRYCATHARYFGPRRSN